jgi:hypothetical protein
MTRRMLGKWILKHIGWDDGNSTDVAYMGYGQVLGFLMHDKTLDL